MLFLSPNQVSQPPSLQPVVMAVFQMKLGEPALAWFYSSTWSRKEKFGDKYGTGSYRPDFLRVNQQCQWRKLNAQTSNYGTSPHYSFSTTTGLLWEGALLPLSTPTVSYHWREIRTEHCINRLNAAISEYKGAHSRHTLHTDWLTELIFHVPLEKNRSLQTCSFQPISWLSTEETKPNTTKANNTRTKSSQLTKTEKHTKR